MRRPHHDQSFGAGRAGARPRAGGADRGRQNVLSAALGFCLCILTGRDCAAEVLIGPGDSFDVVVSRLPSLHIHTVVDADGTADLAEAGELRVGGLTVKEARRAVQQALAASAFRRDGDGSRSGVVTVETSDVAVTVGYRPVYLSGDILRPGEQPFREGMTLRQALAAAGGIRLLRADADARLAMDAQAEYSGLALNFVADSARAWRLNAELGSNEAFNPRLLKESLKDSPVSDAVISHIFDIEAQRLNAWREEGQRQREFITQNIAQIATTIAVVSKQKEDEEKGTAADAEELNTLMDLRSRGNVTSMRVNDVRRFLLLASTRTLQIQAELLRLKIQRDEVGERLAALDKQRRAAALADLSVVNATLETTRLKLAATRDKLKVLNVRPSRSGTPNQLLYTLYRKAGQREGASLIDEGHLLAPGDVVEVVSGEADSLSGH